MPTPVSAPPPKLPGAAALGATVLAALAAFALVPALRGEFAAEFVNFDDPFFFGPENHVFRERGLAGVLADRIANAWLPVAHASLYLDWLLSPADPVWPRLHSVLLHGLNGWLVLRLVAALGAGRAAAAVVAGLFVLHPALVESAAWVSGRKDLLAATFGLGAAVAAARFGRGERALGGTCAVVAACSALALASKSSAVVLPLLLVVVGLCAGPRGPLRLAPAAVAAAVTAVLAPVHLAIAAGEGTLVAGSALDRAAQVPGALLHYLLTTVWPTALDVLYPEVATLEAFRSGWLVGGVAAVLVLLGCLAALRRRPLVAAGLAIWLLALLPFNTAWPASSIAAADRYLYFAIPGAALALVASAPRLGPLLGAVALVPLALLCVERVGDFRDSEALWRASLARDERNSVAWFNLAVDRNVHGADIDAVREMLERAAETAEYPQHRLRAELQLVGIAELDGKYGLAALHAERAVAAADRLPAGDVATAYRVDARIRAAYYARRDGDEAKARSWFEAARELAPTAPGVIAHGAAVTLGELRAGERRVPDPSCAAAVQAVAALDAALEAVPGDYHVNLARGQWAEGCGELLRAELHYRRAIESAPQRPEAYLSEASMYLAEGMFEEAERTTRAGLAAGARHPGLLYDLGIALFGQGHYRRAREYYEAYLVARPTDRAARVALASVLAAETMRDLHTLQPDELERRGARVLELDAGNGKAFLMTGLAAKLRGDRQQAVVSLERAMELLPGDEDARRLLADAYRDRGWELLLAGERRDAALDYFRRFLDVVPDGVPTDAVVATLRAEWERQRDAGRGALLRGELEAAERALRRCIELLPDETAAAFPLGLTLFQRGAGHLDEALAWFERAETAQRKRGADVSLSLLYRVRTLVALGRDEEGVRIADAFLAEHGERAPAEVVGRIRAAIGR